MSASLFIFTVARLSHVKKFRYPHVEPNVFDDMDILENKEEGLEFKRLLYL